MWLRICLWIDISLIRTFNTGVTVKAGMEMMMGGDVGGWRSM